MLVRIQGVTGANRSRIKNSVTMRKMLVLQESRFLASWRASSRRRSYSASALLLGEWLKANISSQKAFFKSSTGERKHLFLLIGSSDRPY
jgi:hypothetical protein